MLANRISRTILRRPIRTLQVLKFSDEKKPPSSNDDGNDNISAADRLNRLLASMSTDDNVKLAKSVKVTKAGGRKQQRAAEEKAKNDAEKKPKNIVEAAQDVGNLLGDTTKQTESELLSKLLGNIEGTATDQSEHNLGDLIVGMKIDRTKQTMGTQTRGEFVRKAISSRQDRDRQQQYRPRTEQRRPVQPHPPTGSVDLFGSEPIGIFKNKEALKEQPDILKTWNRLSERELKLAITHPPSNYFEKTILWTEQGKLWQFPINNEQGMEEEAKVDFTEHIFLEQHLESWCPTKGPIRHFMELVCVGLSKNHYITAQDKKDHIMWFKDYFEQKKDIIQNAIVGQQQKESTAPKLSK